MSGGGTCTAYDAIAGFYSSLRPSPLNGGNGGPSFLSEALEKTFEGCVHGDEYNCEFRAGCLNLAGRLKSPDPPGVRAIRRELNRLAESDGYPSFAMKMAKS